MIPEKKGLDLYSVGTAATRFYAVDNDEMKSLWTINSYRCIRLFIAMSNTFDPREPALIPRK